MDVCIHLCKCAMCALLGPLSYLASHSMRQLLVVVLHCQEPRDRLSVGFGILWAVAQVSVSDQRAPALHT